ncbi:MAG: hypothetical protein ACO1OT_05885 [Heyndrickxia sp.]
MDRFNLTLFGLGMVLLLLALIILVSRLKKSKKIPLGVVSIILIGFISLASSIVLMLPSVKSNMEKGATSNPLKQKKVGTEAESIKEVKKVSNSKSVKTISKFKQTKLKYPIITYQSKYDSYKEYKDADGTVYKNLTMINPNGVMMGFRATNEAIVATPMKNPNNDGLTYYHGYYYYKGSSVFEVSEGTYKYPSKEAAAPYFKDFKADKTENYDSLDLQLYDFIYKFMPTQYPNKDKIVNVPLLEGKWAAYNESLLNGSQLLASINFSKDGLATTQFNILKANEIPTICNYKLEYLDENAYKLYFYSPASNANGNKVSEEPYKRNFIIYVTGKDTFQFVYYDTKLVRNSITMKRE